jgi:four helix bundle protein
MNPAFYTAHCDSCIGDALVMVMLSVATIPVEELPVTTHGTASSIRSYRDLRVWQVAMDLAIAIYAVTKKLPREEEYGLKTQLRRAAVSIPSNIAEGHERDHLGDYIRSVSIAKGSLGEVETQLEIGRRLEYFTPAELEKPLLFGDEVSRMLGGLSRSLRSITRT